jgi:ATP-dependent Lon protease
VTPDAGPVIPAELPLLPLLDTVVFPLAVAPLSVGQERSVKLVDEAMRGSRIVGLFAQRSRDVPATRLEDLYAVGTAATIRQLHRMPDGSLRLVVQGFGRVRLGELVRAEPYLVGRVERFPDRPFERDVEIEGLTRAAKDVFEKLAEHLALPEELRSALGGLDDPVQVGWLLATMSPLPLEARQELLETDEVGARLRKLVEHLQHELAVREIEEEIASEAHERMSKTQREYVLRERLRAIQEELGEEEEGGEELQELRRKLEEAKLGAEARREAERELARLERLPEISPEHGMIRTYLDWLLGVPWGKYTGGTIDLERSRRILDEDHYDLEGIKERILEYLAVKRLRDERQMHLSLAGAGEAGHAAEAGPLPMTPADEARREPILCFVGPPGVGKTSLGQSIARAMGRKFLRVSLGGVHDESEIRGHRRTYVGALPGRIVQALRRVETADPVFMLDEVDKLGQGFHGDPAAALLEVLDPAQNHAFVDTYLGVPVDLSHVLFICTANTTDTIAPPLLDRMEVVRLSGYTDQEKLHIARRYLLPQQRRAHGLLADEVEVDDDALRRVIREYTREAGVRNLEREIASLMRKAARRVGEGAPTPLRIDAAAVPEYLGRQRFFDEVAERIDRPGVATGLAWTPVGGEVLFVEAALVPSRGEGLILTGMLGNVMQESAQAALTFLRSHAAAFGIDPKAFLRKAVHVHVPAGGIPKDGPSAGVAIFTALASAASGRPVRPHLAMTGEITLRGKVLPVGGIKEKLLAAHRAGIRTVAIPRRNEADLEQIPEEVRRELSVHLLDSAEELPDLALEPPAQAAAASAPPPAQGAVPEPGAAAFRH